MLSETLELCEFLHKCLYMTNLCGCSPHLLFPAIVIGLFLLLHKYRKHFLSSLVVVHKLFAIQKKPRR